MSCEASKKEVAVYRPLVAFIALGVFVAPGASAQPARAPAAPRIAGPAAVPVPRTEFIQTMDTEFRRMDANKNNVLTRAEIEQFQRTASLLEAQARIRALFARLDTDKNGQLSEAEFGKMPVTVASTNAGPMIGQYDLNRDGSITLVEYRTA